MGVEQFYFFSLQEREKKREEKRIQAEYLKEWSRPRDDLECEDLQVGYLSLLTCENNISETLFLYNFFFKEARNTRALAWFLNAIQSVW